MRLALLALVSLRGAALSVTYVLVLRMQLRHWLCAFGINRTSGQMEFDEFYVLMCILIAIKVRYCQRRPTSFWLDHETQSRFCCSYTRADITLTQWYAFHVSQCTGPPRERISVQALSRAYVLRSNLQLLVHRTTPTCFSLSVLHVMLLTGADVLQPN